MINGFSRRYDIAISLLKNEGSLLLAVWKFVTREVSLSLYAILKQIVVVSDNRKIA